MAKLLLSVFFAIFMTGAVTLVAAQQGGVAKKHAILPIPY
jgi:hypothetical protein